MKGFIWIFENEEDDSQTIEIISSVGKNLKNAIDNLETNEMKEGVANVEPTFIRNFGFFTSREKAEAELKDVMLGLADISLQFGATVKSV